MRILVVTNLYPSEQAPTQGTFVASQVNSLRALGVEVEVLYVNRAAEGMRAYVGLESRVGHHAREWGAEVVHAMYGGVMARAAVRGAGALPTVVSFCGSDLLGDNLSGLVRKAISRYGVWCSWSAARQATQLIAKSRRLAAALPRATDRARVHVIPNGVDLSRFRQLDRSECRRRLGMDAGGFRVLFATSADDPVKRRWLAEAAVQYARAVQPEIQLCVMRKVPHAEVPYWMNACDALILTSRHEGSPNVVKEALACGVPVVAVPVGDVEDRLEGIPGCYVAEPSAAALGEALLRVYSGPRRLGPEAAARMAELALPRVAERVRSVYTAAIAAAREATGR